MSEDYWKKKLIAYLHDPPCKALDFTRAHEELAMGFVKAALPGEDNQAWYGWMEGLRDSDWFASEADRISGFGKGKHVTEFKDGSKFRHPLGAAEYEFRSISKNKKRAEEILQDVQKGIQTDPNASPEEQARQNFFFHWRRWLEESVQAHDGVMREVAFYPADTRIPDHTIWNHMSVTSALQGCRDENQNIRVSFLLFQIGPVQEFISQARSTRDLWCGSYLLSWLIGSAIKAITDELGPDHIIFPALRAQGVFDALHRNLYEKIKYGDDSLWQRIYKDGTEKEKVDRARKLLSPTLPNRFFAIVPQGREEELAVAAENALKRELNRISECCWKAFLKLIEVKNENNLANMKRRWDRQVELFIQTSWAAEKLERAADWQETFETVSKQLAARRNTRNFEQFVTDEHQRGARKDVLTGKEEVIGDESIWDQLYTNTNDGVFKEGEGPYGAISIIKRLWCRTETEDGLLSRLNIDEGTFKKALRMDSLPKIASRNAAGSKNGNPQNPYVAVIAFDGDQIGKWLSGENMPKLKDQVASHLSQNVNPEEKRKLTPSFHAQFSEALANYSARLAKRVVEKYEGLLIYAGGDDVLCIVPADKALDCAADLRALFKGNSEVLSDKKRTYEFGITQHGFVLADEFYPLIVPGPAMDASCGIAVGHYKYPLQALVREAHAAEKRAKKKYTKKDEKGKYDSGAFALSLIKRSGEIIYWGGSWKSMALAVYRDFTRKTEKNQFSCRFPYALAELLKPYRLEEEPQVDLKPIIRKEFKHVQSQQALKKGATVEGALKYLEELQDYHRLEDFPNLFLASAFINRQRGGN